MTIQKATITEQDREIWRRVLK